MYLKTLDFSENYHYVCSQSGKHICLRKMGLHENELFVASPINSLSTSVVC